MKKRLKKEISVDSKFFVKNKEAQANILTTVLIIVGVIVAITVVYNVVNPLISKKSGEVLTRAERLQLMQALSVEEWIDNVDGTLEVVISRDSTPGDFQAIKYIITTDEETCYVEQPDLLLVFETKSFLVDVSSCSGNIIGISVQPLLLDDLISEMPQVCDFYIDSCQTINQPGVYCLNKSLSGLEEVYDRICFTINSNDITFDCQGNSIIQNSSLDPFDAPSVNGISILGKNAIVKNCNIEVDGAHNVALVVGSIANNSKILDNHLIGGNAGITIGSDNNFIKGNTIKNKVSHGKGIYVISSNNIIQNNDISAVIGAQGIYFYNDESNNSVIGNNIHSSSIGFYHGMQNNNLIKDNYIHGNREGIQFYRSSNIIVTGNKFCSNDDDIDVTISNSISYIDNIFSRACMEEKIGAVSCSDCGFLGWGCDEQECLDFGVCSYENRPWPQDDCTDIQGVEIIRTISDLVDGNKVVTLSLRRGADVLEGDILIIAEDFFEGNIIESDIVPLYNFGNNAVWAFSSFSGASLGGTFLEDIPDSISYIVSGDTNEIKGKWAFEASELEGDII